MNRRRQVEPAHPRLEIMNVERPGIVIAVPTNYVEWMMIEDHLGDGVVLLHQQCEVPTLVVRLEITGASDVALRIGARLEQLPVFVSIASRRAHVTGTLNHEQDGLFRCHRIPVQNASWDDKIISLPKRDASKRR